MYKKRFYRQVDEREKEFIFSKRKGFKFLYIYIYIEFGLILGSEFEYLPVEYHVKESRKNENKVNHPL